MDRRQRQLGPVVSLLWGVLATVFWGFNAVAAVTGDAGPSVDALLVALALTMAGFSVGLTLSTVVALPRQGLRADPAAADQVLWLRPMGIGLLGLATAPLFTGTMGTIDQVSVAVGSLAAGFVLGTASGLHTRRLLGRDHDSDRSAQPFLQD